MVDLIKDFNQSLVVEETPLNNLFDAWHLLDFLDHVLDELDPIRLNLN